jgi:hypothetical protein
LRNDGPPIHSITVPIHNPLKTGTLHATLLEVAQQRPSASSRLLNYFEVLDNRMTVPPRLIRHL